MNKLKNWLKSDVALLVWRIFLLHALWFITKIVFYIYNRPLCGDIAGEEFWTLMLGSYRFDTVSILYINGLFVVLSLLPFRFREQKWYSVSLFWYYVVVNSVALLINIADAVYFRYTQSRFTSNEIFFAENDNSLKLAFKFATENWYLVVVWIVLIALLVLLFGRKTLPRTPIKSNPIYYIVNTAILFIAVPVCIAGIRGGDLKVASRPITLTNATMYTVNPAKVNLILSNPFCILRPLGENGGGDLKSVQYFGDPKMLKSIFTPYHYPADQDSSAVKGAFKGYNVVVFVLESFSAEHSALLNPDLYPDGKGYTPFLDSLMRQGYTFHRGYANGSKSVAALPSVLASIPSYKTSFMLMPESLGKGDEMPKIFDRQGYQTMFFNGSIKGSMGFEAYGRLAGINKFYSMEDYVAAHGKAEYDGVWGIWDEPFIDYMGQVMDQTKQPFFSTIFTISSHHPYKIPEKYQGKLPLGKTKIHAPIAYTDISLRHFFEKYKDSPWMNNTLFVFTADHVSSERWAAKTETPLGLQHIILFYYSPNGKLQGQSNHVSQQIDIMPTVLGLTGYDEPYFAFGRDVFNEPEREPFVVTYNSLYQGISDSLTFYFDEQKIVKAYQATDTLQRHNMAVANDTLQNHYSRLMKGIIQQYYIHIANKNYLAEPKR